MKLQQAKIKITGFQKDMLDTFLTKSADYAESGDILSNFKKTAIETGLSAEQVCMVFINTKVTRLNNMIKTGSVNNESVSDSLKDLANYCVILDLIRCDI